MRLNCARAPHSGNRAVISSRQNRSAECNGAAPALATLDCGRDRPRGEPSTGGEELRSDCATAEAIVLRGSASCAVGAVQAAAGRERALDGRVISQRPTGELSSPHGPAMRRLAGAFSGCPKWRTSGHASGKVNLSAAYNVAIRLGLYWARKRIAARPTIATHKMTTPLNLMAARGAAEDLMILSYDRPVVD
jgi:hypothetical protein